MVKDAAQAIRALASEARHKRAAAQERLDKARRDIDRLDVEIDAFARALAAIEPDDAESAAEPAATKAGDAALSDKWANIYRSLYEVGKSPYSYEDIVAAAEIAGYEVKAAATRTQMMNAVNNGFFERTGPGRFTFTDAGLVALGVDRKENEPPKGGSDTGEVPASSDPAHAPGYQFRLAAADPSPHNEGEKGG
ncbi:hypothetical protein [Jannaschia formosa]|uniref:hypothetical protein n=1 Tax=Jannaschia formosa TaxID=2259592 RepID=UPI001074A34E|nr:hypothetical protein [Jannaschia formosa]TFL16020.1 hypothetical protein DR046_22265 [Jannaschia formosa]